MAETWTPVYSVDFATVGVGNPPGTFTDVQGAGVVYTVVDSVPDGQHILSGLPSQQSNAYQFDFLTIASTAEDQQVVFYTGYSTSYQTGSTTNGRNGWYAALRYNGLGGAGATDCYLVGYEGYGLIRIYTYLGGTVGPNVAGTTLLRASGGAPWIAGHKYKVVASVTGIGTATITCTVTDLSTGVTYAPITWDDTTTGLRNSTTGKFALCINNVGNTTSPASTPFTAVSFSYGYGLTAAETTVPADGASHTIHLTGSGTTWIATPPTFTVVGATKTGQTPPPPGTDTAGTVTITTPTTPGQIVITDSTTGATATVYCVKTSTVADTNLVLSPYNWHVNGSTSATTNTPGAYLKLAWTGSYCALTVDNTNLTTTYGSSNTAFFPELRYSVDNGPFTDVNLNTAGTSTGSIILANGLANAAHTLEVIFNAQYLSGTNYDNWNTPGAGWVLTGVVSDSALAALSYPITGPNALPLYPKRLLCYGDSITAGYYITGAGSPITQNSAQQSYASLLGKTLNAEVGIVGMSAQGWNYVGAGNVPKFPDAWDYYYSGQPRLVGGLLDPAPDYIMIMQGENDAQTGQTNEDVINAITTTLPSIRAAAPSALIFVVIPMSGAVRAAITTGVQTYQQTTPDPLCIIVDMGALSSTCMSLGLTWAGNSAVQPPPFLTTLVPYTQQATDSIHPRAEIHAQAASRIFAAVLPYANSPPGSVGFRWTSCYVFTLPGEAPTLYMARADVPMISTLNTFAVGTAIGGVVYETESVGDRGLYKRGVKVKLFGTGTLTGGTITVTPDKVTGKAVSAPALGCLPTDPYRGILLEYFLPAGMTGYVFDTVFDLQGIDLLVSDFVFVWDRQDDTP